MLPPTQDPDASRMTIVTHGDDATMEQIVKQLNKLVEVIKVIDYRSDEYIGRELVFGESRCRFQYPGRSDADHRYFQGQNCRCPAQEHDHRDHRRRKQGREIYRTNGAIWNPGCDPDWESRAATEIKELRMGWLTGLEPATARTTIWGSTIEL